MDKAKAQFLKAMSRHPVGSAVKPIGDDAFVNKATMTIFDEKIADAPVTKLLADHEAGKLDIMWTHTPPFGRISAVFTFEAGRIVKVETHSLD